MQQRWLSRQARGRWATGHAPLFGGNKPYAVSAPVHHHARSDQFVDGWQTFQPVLFEQDPATHIDTIVTNEIARSGD